MKVFFFLFILLPQSQLRVNKLNLNDTRQLEMLLVEISTPLICETSKNCCTNSNDSLTPPAQNQIQQVIDNFHDTMSDDELLNCPEVTRLQFITCQLQNSLIPKNRRRYNILTQILSLKTHLISPGSYKYLQGLSCLSLPHFNTLEKLYSSFGLENEFLLFLKEFTQSISVKHLEDFVIFSQHFRDLQLL